MTEFSGLNRSLRAVRHNQSEAPNTEKSSPISPAVDVLGVAEYMAEGFTPIEELTGVFWPVKVWPREHVRSVPETRPEWSALALDNRLWLIRSPWSGITAAEALSILWANLPADESQWMKEATEILSWPITRARAEVAQFRD